MGIVRVEDIFRIGNTFPVVGDIEEALIFSFPGRDRDFAATGVFNGIEDNIADDGIETVVFTVDAEFAGEDF